MKFNQFLLVVVFLAIYNTTSVAQVDSNKAELNLDFLIRRIVGGYGFGIDYFNLQENYIPTYNNYESYSPMIMLAKNNFLMVNLNNYSYHPTSGSYQNKWTHSPEINVLYRPQKSVQFYFSNQYEFIDRDFQFTRDSVSYNTSSDINRNSTLRFGAQYLSRGGKTSYDEKLSKWLYYFMNNNILHAAQRTLPDMMLPKIFLEPDQIYFELMGAYHNYKEKTIRAVESLKTMQNRLQEIKSYISRKNIMYDFLIHYNLFNKFFIAQKIGYSTNPTVSDHKQEFEYKEQQITESRNYLTNYDNNRLVYKIEVDFFSHKNILNQLYYTISNDEFNSYSKGIEKSDTISVSWHETESQHRYQNFGYIFNFLKVDKSVPLLNILSDYDNYYGHLLPARAIKGTSALFFVQTKSETFHWQNKSEIPEHTKDLTQKINWQHNLSYGITTDLNLNLEMNVFHEIMESIDIPNLNWPYKYGNGSALSGKLGISFYNYHFDPSYVNWLTLSNFDYWQRPLLKKGMLTLELSYLPPLYSYWWPSNEKKLFEFKLSKLRSSNQNSLEICFGYGLPKNIELDLDLALVRKDFSGKAREFFKRKNIHRLSSAVTLKWQFYNNARISIRCYRHYPIINEPDKYQNEFNISLAALF